jgi:hypothetical protein
LLTQEYSFNSSLPVSLETVTGPTSTSKPNKDEQPGPPSRYNIKGSFSGLFKLGVKI